MNYYEILGVEKTASPEAIKSAFKKLAMKHHPDRGGDSKKFQELNEAYTTLSDPEKKMQYDMGGSNPFHNQGNPFQHAGFHFHTGNNPFANSGHPFSDLFSHFGFNMNGGGFQQQVQRNRDLNIRYGITLKDSYLGKRVNLRFQLPSGDNESLDVDIPPGVENGQHIKLSNYGDNSIRNAPRGDLIIIVDIERDARFTREDIHLITEIEIDVFEAMLGTTKNVENIDGSSVDLTIRPGTRHGQKYSCRGLGFRNIRFNNVKGDLIIAVNVKTPSIKDPKLIDMVKDLANKVRSSEQ